MNKEFEAIVWCPVCRVDKFEVWRVQTSGDAWQHVTIPPDSAVKTCQCGENLERKLPNAA